MKTMISGHFFTKNVSWTCFAACILEGRQSMILKNEYKSTSEPKFIEQISEGGDGIARNVYIAIFKIKLDGMAKTNLSCLPCVLTLNFI